MRTSIPFLLAICALALSLSAPATAQQDHSAHGGAQGQAQISPQVGQFGLTPEQLATAQKIRATQGKQVWMLNQQLKARRIELNALSAADTPDQNRIKALIRDISSLTERELQAEIDLRQQLVKAGIPVWGGRGMGRSGGMMGGGMMGGGQGMGGMGGGMMGGGGCPMMRGGQGAHGAGAEDRS